MRARRFRFIFEQGDKAALAAASAVCAVSIAFSVSEIREPGAPSEDLQRAAARIKYYLRYDHTPPFPPVPPCAEVVATSHREAGATPRPVVPGRMSSEPPPYVVQNPDKRVIRLLAKLGPPTGLTAEADFDAVRLAWRRDPDDAHVRLLRWLVERRAARAAEWERLAILADDPVDGVCSYTDRDVKPKAVLEYRVRGEATPVKPANTDDVRYIVIAPDDLAAKGMEVTRNPESEEVRRSVWTSRSADPVDAAVPSDIRLHLAGLISGPAGRRARITVFKHDREAGWQEYGCLAAAGERVVGRRQVRRIVADGSMRLVTETADTGARLVLIVNSLVRRPRAGWASHLDSGGALVSEPDQKVALVKVRKLKLVDIATGRAFWVLPRNEGEASADERITSRPGPRARRRPSSAGPSLPPGSGRADRLEQLGD